MTGGDYTRTGMLRGGSGQPPPVIQPASAGPVICGSRSLDGVDPLAADASPRIALIRIR